MSFSDISQIKNESKAPGLYIISTPIGNMADITLRALKILKTADVIFCEDTRETRKLLNNYNISGELDSYNDHNAAKKREAIISLLKSGKMVALVSDAGTPLVSDPGYKLVKEATAAGINVVPVPGASSILAALVKSGLPSDNFMFCGFAEGNKLDKFRDIDATLIFFESAKRLVDILAEMGIKLPRREVAVARELTKVYEEIRKGSYAEVLEYYKANPPKGEIVILLSPPEKENISDEEIINALKPLLAKLKLKEASEAVAGKYSISRKRVYELGLELKKS